MVWIFIQYASDVSNVRGVTRRRNFCEIETDEGLRLQGGEDR